MKKKKNIIICTIITLSLIITTTLYFYQKKQTEEYITATVLIADKDYLLVSTKDDQDYLINTTDTNYQEGDTLKLKIKITNDKINPKEATPSKITLIEENTNIIKDSQEDKITPPKEETENIEEIQNTQNETKTESSKTMTEEEIINTFEELDVELTNYNQEEDSTIKEKFVKLIDFIFYEGEIGGKTFSELSNKAKLEIIKLALKIDSKIEEKIPDYKLTLSTKYQNLKSKLIEKYLDTTTTICQKDEELCANAKEGFQDLKQSFSITWDFIKEISSKNLTKLKDWYEIWRYK